MKYGRKYLISLLFFLLPFASSVAVDVSGDANLDLKSLQTISSVVIVKNSYSLKIKPKNSKLSNQIYASIKRSLESYQVKYSEISDQEVEKGALNYSKSFKVAIFPYNGAMSDSELEEISKFVQNGGKILSCYEIPPKLQRIYGLENFSWLKVGKKRIKLIRFLPEATKIGFPEAIKEEPDHIFWVKTDNSAKTIAYWETSNEKNIGEAKYPAAILSKNGVYISSILRGKDHSNIGKLIVGLLTSIPTSISIPELPSNITDITSITNINTNSNANSLRGMWVSIWVKRDWQKIMSDLHEFGFNAAFVQMNTGGSAYYPSEFLPLAVGHPKYVDDLAECIKWARRYGIQVHAWRASWVMHNSPDSFFWTIHSEGRLQRRYDGLSSVADPNVKVYWLCPSNELNRNLEVESLLEMVRKYDIDGIHLDYMRLPNSNYCFDENCKNRFQKELGITVKRWPSDVMEGGIYHKEWRQWRKNLITSLVRRISLEARKLKPKIKISLAARPVLNWAIEYDAQDWPLWAEERSLDFICPMDYTPNLSKFRERLIPQLKAVDGKVPIYPGIGAYMIKSPIQLAAQIELSRSLGAKGFVIFAYNESIMKWMPQLRGILKE